MVQPSLQRCHLALQVGDHVRLLVGRLLEVEPLTADLERHVVGVSQLRQELPSEDQQDDDHEQGPQEGGDSADQVGHGVKVPVRG